MGEWSLPLGNGPKLMVGQSNTGWKIGSLLEVYDRNIGLKWVKTIGFFL